MTPLDWLEDDDPKDPVLTSADSVPQDAPDASPDTQGDDNGTS